MFDFGLQGRVTDLHCEIIRTLAESKRPTLKEDRMHLKYPWGSQVHRLRHWSPEDNFMETGPEFTGVVVRTFDTQNAGWVVLKVPDHNRLVVVCIG